MYIYSILKRALSGKFHPGLFVGLHIYPLFIEDGLRQLKCPFQTNVA